MNSKSRILGNFRDFDTFLAFFQRIFYSFRVRKLVNTVVMGNGRAFAKTFDW